tara:strand:+ start:5859 stop:6242 length:384 start_codon:yes stop_codon:yes gene_type:complete
MSDSKEILFEAIKNSNEKDYWEVMGDAHTIFKPTAFTDLGLPEEFVMNYARTYKSDTSNPKYTIYDEEGEVIKDVQGVMSSSIADALVRVFGLHGAQQDASEKFGRGSALRILSQAIWNYTHALQEV